MEVLKKDGVEKIAVMMSIVSNTRVDIVARGVIAACLELGKDPAETIAVFRIPGAWEEEGAKILDRYGIAFNDSMWKRRPGRREGPRVELVSILLDKDFSFIVQGITGREAVNLTRECLDYGSKVVGGVTPGRKAARSRRTRVRHRCPGGREPRRPDRRLGRHRPPAFTKDAMPRRSRTASS